MADVLARGPNFVFTKEFVLNKYGKEMWERLVAGLAPEDEKVWTGPPLTYESYPFSAFKSMVSALSRELGTREDTETAELYEYIADRSLNVLYKMFFRLANPSFVIRNYPKLWERFFNSGKVEVPVAEKGHAVVRFILPEIFLDWLPPACLGYSKKAVELAGGRNLTMKEKSKSLYSSKEWEIVYELKWEE